LAKASAVSQMQLSRVPINHPLANSEDRIMRREATLLPVDADVTAFADSKRR